MPVKTQKQVISDLMDTAARVLRKREDGFIQDLLAAYEEAGQSVTQAINSVYLDLGEGNWNYATFTQQGRNQDLLAEIHKHIAALNEKAIQITGDGMVDQYQQSASRSLHLLDQATPGNIDPNFIELGDPAVQALVSSPYEGAVFSQRIGHISDMMADEIKHELTQSLMSGDSMPEARDRVLGVIGDEDGGNAYRAEVIARTEIMRASNMGREAVYDANSDIMDGDGENDVWLASADDRLCPWCMRRDGKKFGDIENDADDPFEDSVEQPLHPNCRCTSIPALKSWEDLLGVDMPEDMGPDERGMRDEDGKWIYAPVEDFDDWKQGKMLPSNEREDV